ncbi:hypothetical protein GGI23_001977 [Coemansia sp. RSA 2559]|nr:hypothetical protein GGI23_001977 [Coemansia sp. RSA 2559]
MSSDSSENGNSKKDQNQPTWSQVESTRIKTQRQGKKSADYANAFCMPRLFLVESKSGFYAAEPRGSFVGRVDCLEYITQEMAQRQLEQRIKNKNARESPRHQVKASEYWANRWGLRWILQWRYVTILGNGNISRFNAEREQRREISDTIMERVAAHYKMNKRNVFRAIPVDETFTGSVDKSVAFVNKILGPGFRGIKWFVDGWNSTSQTAFFGNMWADATSLGAFKSIGRFIKTYQAMSKEIDELKAKRVNPPDERDGKDKKP